MARIRTIKPEFWTDGDILKMSRDARLFYIGLWNFADDNGVLEHDVMTIKARIFPCDNIDIEVLLAELEKHRKVTLYEVNGRRFILVKNMLSHQKIDRPRKSHLPLPSVDFSRNQMKSDEISLVRDCKVLDSKVKDCKGGDGKEGGDSKSTPPQSPLRGDVESSTLKDKRKILLEQAEFLKNR